MNNTSASRPLVSAGMRPRSSLAQLPSPGVGRDLTVVVDYSDIMDLFYYNLTIWSSNSTIDETQDESLMRIYEIQPETLAEYGTQLAEKILTTARRELPTHDVTYRTLVTAILTSSKLNRVEWGGMQTVAGEPPISRRAEPVHQHCANVVVDSIMWLIDQVVYEARAIPPAAAERKCEADVILWDALIAIVLRTLQALVGLGDRVGISPTMLTSYFITECKPLSMDDPRSFLITIKGP